MTIFTTYGALHHHPTGEGGREMFYTTIILQGYIAFPRRLQWFIAVKEIQGQISVNYRDNCTVIFLGWQKP